MPPTFRLFVSSTFSDMKAERELLQARVFPRLRDYCKSKGAMFQAVDLRWGISEEAGLDQQTMNICLRELRRCQETTDKPNFLVLLGDRYGWRPLPPQIDAGEFEEMERILTTESTEDTERLKRWYRRDDNAVPAQYVLLPREGEFEEFGNWDYEEKAVRELFLRALETAGWPAADPRREKYEHSATHQEIDAGALALPDPEDRVLACFRTIKNLPEASDTFSDHYPDGTRDEKARHQLNDLRTALEDRIPKSHRYSYEAESLCASAPLRENLHFDQDAFTAWVDESLRKIIDREIEEKQAKAADPLDQENAEHEAFGRERAHRFVGRKDLLDQIGAYMESTDSGQTPFVVHGVSGTGKTALMGKAVLSQRHASDQSTIHNPQFAILLERYIGATPGSSNLRSLLVDLCQQLHRALDFEALKAGELEGLGGVSGEEAQKQRESVEQKYGIPDDLNKLIEHFRGLPARVPEDRRLVLVLDALDQSDDEGNTHTLSWLPDRLPGNVRVVLSVLDRPGEPAGRAAESARLRFPDALREIKPLATGDAGELLDGWLADAGRALQPAQRQSVLRGFADCGLPLWLKLVSEEARTWHAWQEPEGLPVTIPALLDHFLGELEEPGRHGHELVATALGYLAAARNGLADEELLDVVALDKNFWTHFTATARKEHQIPERRLPPVLWARLHGDLAFALAQRHADNATLHTFYHRQIAEAAGRRYLDPRSRELHSRLGDYFHAQPHYHEGKPNLRKLSELVPQWIGGERWDDLTGNEENIGPLSDLLFIQAKCEAGRVHELVADYNHVLASLPEFREENERKLRHQEAMSTHCKALRNYAVLWNRWFQAKVSGNMRPEPKCPPLPLELQHKTKDPIPEESSQRAASLREYSNFVFAHLSRLEKYPAHVFSFACNHAANNSASTSARRHLSATGHPWLCRSPDQPALPFRPECRLKLGGNDGLVTCVCPSPDGRRALSGYDQFSNVTTAGILRLWDLETGQCLLTLKGHTAGVSCACISPDGRTAVSGGRDRTLRLWDLETGHCLRVIECHTGTEEVSAVAITADGARAISSGGRPILEGVATLEVWDLKTSQCLRTISGLGDGVTCLGVSPDGHRAVSGDHNHRLRQWNLETGECQHLFQGRRGRAMDICFSPDGTRALSAECDEKELRLWNLDTGECLRTFGRDTGAVNRVCISPDGRHALSGNVDGSLRLWELETGLCLRVIENIYGSAYDICFCPDGHRILAGAGRYLCLFDLDGEPAPTTNQGLRAGIGGISMSPDERHALSLGINDDRMLLWDMQTGGFLQSLSGHRSYLCHVRVSPDGRRIVSADHKTMCVWDMPSRKCLRTLEGYGSSFCVSPDGRHVLSGQGRDLHLWDLETGDSLRVFKGHEGHVKNVRMSQDGLLALSGSYDKTLRLWNVQSGECLRSFKGHSDWVLAVCFTPDGLCALSGSGDQTMRMWCLATGQCLRVFFCGGDQSHWGQAGHVESICVTPDGRHALSRSFASLKLWNLQTGECLGRLGDVGQTRDNVCLSPDGRKALAGYNDEFLRLWDLETGECLAGYFAGSPVYAAAFSPSGDRIVCGTADGQMHFLSPVNLPASGTPVITALRGQSARCPLCAAEIRLPAEVAAVVLEQPDSLPTSAFDDPRLLTACPHCAKPLKVNPFFVHEWGQPTPQGLASMRASAQESLRKGYWEGAATFLSKLLAAGDPKQEIIPDMILCLVNAHETVSARARAEIDQLLADLEQAGHTDLAARIRQQHAAKLNAPGKKPWWKAW